MKRIGRYSWWLCEMVVGFLTLYVLLFLIGGLIPVGELSKKGEIEIKVQSNGVHTDLCLPVKSTVFNWETLVPVADFKHADKPACICIGWGDKGFFLDTPTWNDLTAKTAFQAAFLPSETAMHVAYLAHFPADSDRVSTVKLSVANYQKLIDFIKNSFELENNQVCLIPNKGYGSYDNFYEANNSYHLFYTCNSWTNEALKIAGVKTGWYVLSEDGIMRHLKK